MIDIRKLAVPGLILAGATVLAGCGDTTTPTSSPSPTGSAMMNDEVMHDESISPEPAMSDDAMMDDDSMSPEPAMSDNG